jgi:molybdate transport system regulatory protein
VVTQKGGSKGGGTVVTETGKKVLEAYKKLTDKLLAVVAAEKELLEVV